jgi:hypothetical protein
VKFPCKICDEDHLTHQFPQMEEAQCLIKLNQQQQPIVLKNPFPQGKNLQGGSSNFNPQGGTSSVPPSDGYQGVVNMLSHLKLKDVDLLTRSWNYDNLESTRRVRNIQKDQPLFT